MYVHTTQSFSFWSIILYMLVQGFVSPSAYKGRRVWPVGPIQPQTLRFSVQIQGYLRTLVCWSTGLGFLARAFHCFMWFCLKCFDLVRWVIVEKHKWHLFVCSSHINQDLSQNPQAEVGRGRTSTKDGSLPTFTTSSSTLHLGLD